jgi:hypothetical protein
VGVIIRTYYYYAEGERVKSLLHVFLSALLLFTAAIVSNIESVQQVLNLTLDAASGKKRTPMNGSKRILSVLQRPISVKLRMR